GEHAEQELYRREIIARESEAMFGGERRNDRVAVRAKRRVAATRAVGRVEDLLDRRLRGDSLPHRTRKEPLDELRTRWGQLEQRFEHQVLHRVLPSDVEDDREPGAQIGDVREALLRPDADVHAARSQRAL